MSASTTTRKRMGMRKSHEMVNQTQFTTHPNGQACFSEFYFKVLKQDWQQAAVSYCVCTYIRNISLSILNYAYAINYYFNEFTMVLPVLPSKT